MSIVVYRPDVVHLLDTLSSLKRATDALHKVGTTDSVRITLVDNGGLPDLSVALRELQGSGLTVDILTGHGNVGYGRGHNLAIQDADSAYHLVLNPDVDLDQSALTVALERLEREHSVGLLSPRIDGDDGQLQFLCRRYPTILDLFCRGFLPAKLRRLFDRRLARYEMRDLVNDHDIVWDPPIVSGCFMLFRTDVLKKLGGFDPRYFLYFEDYDLSLRTHEFARVVYVPSVRVIHHGGGASRKGFVHIRLFVASAFKFFNRFGWRVC